MKEAPSSPDFAALAVRHYAERLASDEPAPGGGSAAAFTAAFGACLVEMVCGINLKRAKNPDPARSGESRGKAEPLRKKLLEMATLDAECYARLVEHWRTKSPELERALEAAARVPMEIAERSLELLKIAATEIPRTSAALVGDLVEAAILLEAAVRSSRLHVIGNARLMKDVGAASRHRKKIEAIAAEAAGMATTFDAIEQKG